MVGAPLTASSAESRGATTDASGVAHPVPMVTVVVPCRNEERYIGACLDSILAGTYPADRLEVLVVDGASDDGTRSVVASRVARYPSVRCLENPNRTAPHALNIGIRRARGDVIVRMDAHCRYPSDYIGTLVRWLERSGADNVGGVCRTLPANDGAIARAIAIALAHPLAVGNSRFRVGVAAPVWVDTVPFGCYRRAVFERIGLFDEQLARNQDDELNHRLLGAGGRILLVPDVVSEYYARGSFPTLARMYYQYGYFKPLVARKLGRIATGRQLAPPVFVLALVAGLVLAPFATSAALALAVLAGVYVAAAFLAAIGAGLSRGLSVVAPLAAAFPVVHLSYGVGYLRGIVDLVGGRHAGSSDTSAIPVSR